MTTWPKQRPILTEEQQRVHDEFLDLWLRTLPKKFGIIEKFNHTYPLQSYRYGDTTLEVGCGIGSHVEYEDVRSQTYYVMDLMEDWVVECKRRHPDIADGYVGDIQRMTRFQSVMFDRVVVVHVLEHLPYLPNALDEIDRVLKPGGTLSIVLPCEGGWLYSLGREVSTKRMFKRYYPGECFDWVAAYEHCCLPHEIIEEVRKRFDVADTTYWPFNWLPFVNTNLVIGMTCKKRLASPKDVV